MKARLILCVALIWFTCLNAGAQTQVSTADFDIYIKDTLRLDISQMELLSGVDIAIRKTLQFKPKTDGFKAYYYISGYKNCEGASISKKKTGEWTAWYDSGSVSSRIIYMNDLKEGSCTYWYRNGVLNATGQYLNDMKEGEWTIYNRDGTLKGKFTYKKGVVVAQ